MSEYISNGESAFSIRNKLNSGLLTPATAIKSGNIISITAPENSNYIYFFPSFDYEADDTIMINGQIVNTNTQFFNKPKKPWNTNGFVTIVLHENNAYLYESDSFTREETIQEEIKNLFSLSNNPIPSNIFRLLSWVPDGKSRIVFLFLDEDGSPVDNVIIQGKNYSLEDGIGIVDVEPSPNAQITIQYPIGYISNSNTRSETITIDSTPGGYISKSISCKKDTSFSARIEESMEITISKNVSSLTAFAVGGGASGAGDANYKGYDRAVTAVGGAGGYTITKNIQLDKKENLKMYILVGAGGRYDSRPESGTYSPSKSGGNTIIKNKKGEELVLVKGGEGSKERLNGDDTNGSPGSDGGSGSAPAAAYAVYSETVSDVGTASGDGTSSSTVHVTGVGTMSAGTGQGTNTRAFGRSNGELFCSPGASAACAIHRDTGSTISEKVNTPPEGGGVAKIGWITSSGQSLTINGGDATTRGSGGGAALINNISGSSYLSGYAWPGAGADGIVLFEWTM